MKRSELMPYEWMIKHTPEEAWIKGQGMLLWLAFFFTEIGAGIYLVSIFQDFRTGWIIGYLVTLGLGGLIHLGFLGKPMRSWRIFFRPKTSELSRGLWVILFYAGIGFFQVAPLVFPGLPWKGDNVLLTAIMGVLCVLLIIHGFLMMSVIRAVPFWNSSIMVLLAVGSGIWVGSQTILFSLYLSGMDLQAAELWAGWSLLGFIGVLVVHLWGGAHSSETARASVKRLVAGYYSLPFYIGVVGLGMVLPLIITIVAWAYGVDTLSGAALFLRFMCVVVGDLTMRYSIMRVGLYTPLIPRKPQQIP